MMSELVIKEPLASEIRAIAEQQQRPPEAVLRDLVGRYQHEADTTPTVIPDYPPRLASSLPDDKIDVPEDMEDKAAYREAVRAMRPKLYEKAREYWRRVGDHARLALTDEELDRVFWLIDHEGTPRFLAEQGQIELPPDPLEALVGLFADSDVTDASTTVRETLARQAAGSGRRG
jgi:hypothetical protein